MKKCYIVSGAQVSVQAALSDEWMDNPRVYRERYVRAIEPDSKGYISPGEARRMSRILKRAVCTSVKALQDAGIENPDAIITGTGMGCMENSEKFLMDMVRLGETCLKPTLFMQSTHNTISSQIAIKLKCHGYNNTYSHGAISFESALLDAWLRIRGGEVGNALIGAHDEVTPLMSEIVGRIHPEYAMISEASVATVLSSVPSGHDDIEITDVHIGSNMTSGDVAARLSSDNGIILWGTNGDQRNDAPYLSVSEQLGHTPVTLSYKRLFGDGFASSAVAFHVAATILRQRRIPEILFDGMMRKEEEYVTDFDSVAVLNHSGQGTWSVIKISGDNKNGLTNRN